MTYPLSLPSSRQIQSFRMKAVDIVGTSQSPFSGAQQVYRYTGQYWEADIKLRPMNREEAELWISFFLKLKSSFGTFLLGDPVGAVPMGIGTGSPLVNGSGQSGSSLITDGWTPNISGILKAGDYIQLGSSASARLYKVLDTVNSNAFGEATLNVWPDLRSSPSDNEAITVNNPKGVFRLSTPSEWNVEEAQTYGISFGARESL